MERIHRAKVQKQFRKHLNGKPIVCLNIPDDYAFMDLDLVRLLEERMRQHWR